jgi:hypothetical protein
MAASTAMVTSGIYTFSLNGGNGRNVSPVVAADFDGDGAADIFVLETPLHRPSSLTILNGRPNGLFVRPNAAADGPQVPYNNNRIPVGDFNMDGRPDVLITGMTRDLMGCAELVVLTDVNEKPQEIATFAPFCDYLSYKYSTIITRTIVGDFNGDGKLDGGFLRAYEWMGGRSDLTIAYGDGTGAFTDFYYPNLAYGTDQEIWDVEVRDLNNDCQPDLLVHFSSGPTEPFYLNGSTFTPGFSPPDGGAPDGAPVDGGATGGSGGSGGSMGTAGTGAAGATGAGGAGGTAAAGGTTGTAGSGATSCAGTTGSAGAGGITVSVDQTSYLSTTAITVTFAGMPGNPDDWIAIAPGCSPTTTYSGWASTAGAINGTVTITAPSGAGAYVARAFPANTFSLIAESSSFPVSGYGVFTNKSSYVRGEQIILEYAGLPGNANGNPTEWIFIAPPGSSATTKVTSVGTDRDGNGSTAFTSAAISTTGTYVARAINTATNTIQFESAPFAVTTGTVPPTPTLSPNATTYAAGATISVSYANLPDSPNGFIVLTPSLQQDYNPGGYDLVPSTDDFEIVSKVHTNGQTSGVATFSTPGPGSYWARFLWDNTYLALGIQSPVFGVTTGSSGVTISSQPHYSLGAQITVTYTGMPGNVDDWIAFTVPEDANWVYLSYVNTNGQINGTATLTNSYGAGTFVARAFAHGTFTLLAQTPFFTVGQP